jgi:hypothetical protein
MRSLLINYLENDDLGTPVSRTLRKPAETSNCIRNFPGNLRNVRTLLIYNDLARLT